MGAKDEFDSESYKQLTVVGEYQPDGKKAKIVAAVFQYKDNAPKLKVQRVGKKNDGSEYTSDLGGTTVEESEAVGKLYLEGAKALKKIK